LKTTELWNLQSLTTRKAPLSGVLINLYPKQLCYLLPKLPLFFLFLLAFGACTDSWWPWLSKQKPGFSDTHPELEPVRLENAVNISSFVSYNGTSYRHKLTVRHKSVNKNTSRNTHQLFLRKYTVNDGHAVWTTIQQSTLKLEAVRSSETSVKARSTQRHIPEDILHSHRRENLKSYNNPK
jgi:hypothetical protein